MCRSWCLILCLVAASQQLSITDFAVPSAVRIGENAELQCRHSVGEGEDEANVYVKWWWTPLNAQIDMRQMIYQRISGQKPNTQHKNISVKENDTIEVLDLQPRDSGVYECVVSDDVKEPHQWQQLVVYTPGSGPTVNVTRVEDGPDDDEEEDVVVTCEASGVAPEPELLISVDGQVIIDAELVNETGDGVYSVFANATLSREVEAGAEIRCELYFTNKNVSHEAYFTTMTYDNGAEASTTQAPEDTTFWASTTDSNQNDTSGSTQLAKSWALLVSIAVPVQLLALH